MLVVSLFNRGFSEVVVLLFAALLPGRFASPEAASSLKWGALETWLR